MAAALLSAGESARLNESLVYRQRLAAQAGFDADLRAGPGLLIAFAMAAGSHPVDRVARALEKEVLRLAGKPVSAAEFQQYKTDPDFRRNVGNIVQPGTTVVITPASLRSGAVAQPVTVIEAERKMR